MIRKYDLFVSVDHKKIRLPRADAFLYKSILQKYSVDTVEEVSETV